MTDAELEDIGQRWYTRTLCHGDIWRLLEEVHRLRKTTWQPARRVTCSRCNTPETFTDGYSDLIATATHTEYVTLCRKCYRKAGNTVR